MIPNTRVFNWSRVVPDEQLLSLLDDSDYQPVLLFPCEYAVKAQSESQCWNHQMMDGRKVAFIIDATWQQARRCIGRALIYKI